METAEQACCRKECNLVQPSHKKAVQFDKKSARTRINSAIHEMTTFTSGPSPMAAIRKTRHLVLVAVGGATGQSARADFWWARLMMVQFRRKYRSLKEDIWCLSPRVEHIL